MTDTTCKGCGRSLAEVGTTRVAAGRRWSRKYGWHNATAAACAYCGTWVRWNYQPHGYADPDGVRIPNTVDALEEYASRCGSHFFDPDTLRFFGSRILSGVTIHDGRAYFVTSERDNYTEGPRRYSARYMTAGAQFYKVGSFQQYDTAAQARAAIRAATS
jgi:hypothetical protein